MCCCICTYRVTKTTNRVYHGRMNANQILRLIEDAGGRSVVMAACGVKSSAVGNWVSRERIPVEYCPTLERLTHGRWKCERMHPGVEWGVLRGSAPLSLSLDFGDE